MDPCLWLQAVCTPQPLSHSVNGKYTHTHKTQQEVGDRVTSTPLVCHMLSLGGQKVCKLVEGTSSKMRLFLTFKTFYGSGQDSSCHTRELQQ